MWRLVVPRLLREGASTRTDEFVLPQLGAKSFIHARETDHSLPSLSAAGDCFRCSSRGKADEEY